MEQGRRQRCAGPARWVEGRTEVMVVTVVVMLAVPLLATEVLLVSEVLVELE